MVVAGGNYGWDKRECGYCYPLSDPHNPDLCVDEKEITPGIVFTGIIIIKCQAILTDVSIS